MNLKKIGKVFTSKFVGTGPSSYKKRIYRAVVSQRLRNTVLEHCTLKIVCAYVREQDTYMIYSSQTKWRVGVCCAVARNFTERELGT
jgi:hypothetical protein